MHTLEECMTVKRPRVFACIVAASTVLLLLTVNILSPQWTHWQPIRQTWASATPRFEDMEKTDIQEEVHHVVFVKVHKAASSTVQSILLRFAMDRQLNVLLPRYGNILNNYVATLPQIIEHPPSPPFLFDILCNHFLFNETELRPYFPTDTMYVAIVREPWELIKSAYHYFRDLEHFAYLKQCPSFEDYVSNPLAYEPSQSVSSLTMNRMSIDLGVPLDQLWNMSYSPTFLQYLNKTFHLVLIADRFDESMVLLKRTFNWQTRDILYIKINQNTNRTHGPEQNITTALQTRLLLLNHHDVALYRHFLRVFQEKVDAQGPDFEQEVEGYSTILNKLAAFCSLTLQNDTLTVNATQWNKKFDVHKADCKLMNTTELYLVELAKRQQRMRMEKLKKHTDIPKIKYMYKK